MEDKSEKLSDVEATILRVLCTFEGRVLGRVSILRMSGLSHCGPRRCDSAMVSIRRVIGGDNLVNVRRRGWILTGDGARMGRSYLSGHGPQ